MRPQPCCRLFHTALHKNSADFSFSSQRFRRQILSSCPIVQRAPGAKAKVLTGARRFAKSEVFMHMVVQDDRKRERGKAGYST